MAYQPIQMPQPEGLGGIAEFIMQLRSQANQENARRSELLLRQQGQESDIAHRAALEKNATAQMDMAKSREGERSAERRLEATQKVTAAIDAGRPDLARQIAQTFGIPISEIAGQDPRDTLMKPSQYERQAPEMGPQATPEIAAQAGFYRAREFAGDSATKDDFRGEMDAAEAERRRFAQAQQPTGPEPQMPMQPKGAKYSIAGESYDPEEIRRSQAAKIDEASQRFAGAMQGVEGLGKYIPVYQAGVAAGLPSEKSFELMQKRMEMDEARASREENARLQREQSDVNNRRIAGAMGNRVSHDDKYKGPREARGEEQAIDAMTKTVFGQTGFKEQQIANRRFNDMAAKLAVGNSAVDVAVMGEWAKQAQGGVGVLTDSDMKVFYERIGGFGVRGEEMIQKAINGQMGEGRRKLMNDAVKWLAGRANTNLGEIKSALQFRLDNSAFAHRTNDILGTYFPETRGKIEDARAIDRAKNRTRTNRLKGAGRDALDEDLDGL